MPRSPLCPVCYPQKSSLQPGPFSCESSGTRFSPEAIPPSALPLFSSGQRGGTNHIQGGPVTKVGTAVSGNKGKREKPTLSTDGLRRRRAGLGRWVAGYNGSRNNKLGFVPGPCVCLRDLKLLGLEHGRGCSHCPEEAASALGQTGTYKDRETHRVSNQ